MNATGKILTWPDGVNHEVGALRSVAWSEGGDIYLQLTDGRYAYLRTDAASIARLEANFDAMRGIACHHRPSFRQGQVYDTPALR